MLLVKCDGCHEELSAKDAVTVEVSFGVAKFSEQKLEFEICGDCNNKLAVAFEYIRKGNGIESADPDALVDRINALTAAANNDETKSEQKPETGH